MKKTIAGIWLLFLTTIVPLPLGWAREIPTAPLIHQSQHEEHPASKTSQNPKAQQKKKTKGSKKKKSDTTGHQHEGHDMGHMKGAAEPAGQERHMHSGQMKQPEAQMQHPAHDMSKMPGESHEHAMMETISGGPFRSMHAIASGTSLLPSTVPGYMWHWMKDDWMFMLHGQLAVGWNHQGGPRGVNKAESQNWLMAMAERPLGSGRLLVRGMFSAEPLTAPHGGFPELFQTGETYRSRPIVDAQHPHDLFMELSACYTVPLTEQISFQIYGGPVAEPALGPVAFMHRASAMENPAAPLGHHLQDSTHISHGVITGGVTAWRFRFEGSAFHGAEPDENRADIELGKLDSWSARAWLAPTPNWTMQVSHGHLHNPEAAAPGDIGRTTASISHNLAWSDGNWASTLIWGRNHEVHGNFNSYLLESTVNFLDKNYAYTRLELVDKIGLLQQNVFGRSGAASVNSLNNVNNNLDVGAFFRIGAFTLGAVRDVVSHPKARLGLGVGVTFYQVPESLHAVYGSHPVSFQAGVRLRPGKMQ